MAAQEKVLIESAAELHSWLLKNFRNSESVWLVKWKKNSGMPYFSYDEMVDELIAFGWVDSLPRKLDERQTMCRISPRNPKSNWSKVNKDRAERLLRKGRMHPAGLALVEQAKENGAWTFLDDVEQLIIPPDLESALSANKQAAFYFERFPKSSKRGILEWIKNAKRAPTRKSRIEETVNKAALNIKANHPKGRGTGPKE
ncbi:MAG: YdeI/OmpD-associated family protein [Bacteroidota bacterium]